MVMPTVVEIKAKSIAFWDRELTTRCFWDFTEDGEERREPSVLEFIEATAKAEQLLSSAERISKNIMHSVQRMLDNPLSRKGR